MKSVKFTLFTSWHWMRWIRLITGIVVLVHGFNAHDSLLVILASFILFQAITNTGCYGSGGCNLPNTKK